MSQPKVPFDRSKTWPLAAAIGLNLIPVIGVLIWGWSAFALIMLYWLENLIVGVRTLVSMFANAAVTGSANWVAALFFGAFFTVHYGLFCFVHGIFVLLLFGDGFEGDTMFNLAGAVGGLFASQVNLAIGFASIVVWQVIQFALWIARGEMRRGNLLELMGAPYPRIITLHFAIIFGGFLLTLLNQPVAGVAVLALMKMAYDAADVLRSPAPKPATVSAAEPGLPR